MARGRKREVEYLEYYKERWNQKLSLPSGSMVRSQPKLLLSAMSESMAMQQKRLLLMSLPHITTMGHGVVPWEAASGPTLIFSCCAQFATTHWIRYSDKLASWAAFGTAVPIPRHSSTVELTLLARSG